MTPATSISGLGRFATHHALAILFISAALCGAGMFCARNMPSSVFPQTDVPRGVVLVDNGVMPGDEMMATITRPIEEAMKDIPGAVTVRSNTGRGSAEINVFFNWRVDMIQSELYVLGRLAQIRSTLPPTATTTGRLNKAQTRFIPMNGKRLSYTSATDDQKMRKGFISGPFYSQGYLAELYHRFAYSRKPPPSSHGPSGCFNSSRTTRTRFFGLNGF